MPGHGMFEVANEVLRLSRARKLAWNQTMKDNEYRVSFPDISLAISFNPKTGSYTLNLLNETGSVAQSLKWDQDCDTETTRVGKSEFSYHSLFEIYELAQAYMQEASVNRALQYLKQT